MTAIARRLGVDRRVLKGIGLPHVRQAGVIWLERRALAAYLWSRPRCIVCDRRVIGEGPGCHLHRRNGRRRVFHYCGECGRETTGRGELCRSCATRERNAQRGPEALDRLREGKAAYTATILRVKAERGLLNVGDAIKRLHRAGLPGSPAVITGHMRDGLISPARRPDGRPFRRPLLFEAVDVDQLPDRVRALEDGRRTRFHDDEYYRGFVKRRHGVKAARKAGGRRTAVLGKGADRSRSASELERRIADALASGMTRTATATLVGCTERYVRIVASRTRLPQGQPGRPRTA
jgi:hypothetical protein